MKRMTFRVYAYLRVLRVWIVSLVLQREYMEYVGTCGDTWG